MIFHVPAFLRQFTATSLAMLALAACSESRITAYQSRPQDYHSQTPDHALATLQLNGTQAAPTPRLDLYKIRKGYAMRNTLDQTPSQSTALKLSHDHEYQWFSGLEWRWNF